MRFSRKKLPYFVKNVLFMIGHEEFRKKTLENRLFSIIIN